MLANWRKWKQTFILGISNERLRIDWHTYKNKIRKIFQPNTKQNKQKKKNNSISITFSSHNFHENEMSYCKCAICSFIFIITERRMCVLFFFFVKFLAQYNYGNMILLSFFFLNFDFCFYSKSEFISKAILIEHKYAS